MYGYARYGMWLSDLSYNILCSIVKIYVKIVGGSALYYLRPGKELDIKKRFNNSGDVEWKIGSRLDSFSKLWFRTAQRFKNNDRLIYFNFSANFDPRLDNDEEAAKKLSKEFAEAVDKFLKDKGLAVKL